MFDFATTVLSGVKVVDAKNRGESLPEGAIVDRNGNPTTNPDDFFNGGSHLAFGGHKGYALMMAAEYLGRIFTGADSYIVEHRAGPVMRYQGVTMIVFSADLFQPFDTYSRRADEMARRARAVPPAPGFNKVMAPGDPEAETRAVRRREGVPVPDDIWQSLVDTATKLGVGDLVQGVVDE
jgi:LDH2 family malate/lactate/ureidoglycolate dehydrogenase